MEKHNKSSRSGEITVIVNLQFTCNELSLTCIVRSRPPDLLSGKDGLKICSKFTGEHPYQSAISIKLQSNFIEITLRHGCSPVNLLHIFRAPFSKNTSGPLLLFYTFPKAIVHECQRSCNFQYIYSNFVYNMSDEAVIVLSFYIRRNKAPSVLLPKRDKRVAIIFHENQRLNLGN